MLVLGGYRHGHVATKASRLDALRVGQRVRAACLRRRTAARDDDLRRCHPRSPRAFLLVPGAASDTTSIRLYSDGIRFCLAALALLIPAFSAQEISLELLASGLNGPVDMRSARDGSGRLFVADQSGRIRVIRNGQLGNEPFLDIQDRVVSGSERGLLYPQSGRCAFRASPSSRADTRGAIKRRPRGAAKTSA